MYLLSVGYITLLYLALYITSTDYALVVYIIGMELYSIVETFTTILGFVLRLACIEHLPYSSLYY